MSEERITAAVCTVCHQPIKHGQVVSGARMSEDAEEMVGHYLCIVHELGPEKTLQAILAHRLPALDPATMVDGRVPEWQNLFDVDET